MDLPLQPDKLAYLVYAGIRKLLKDKDKESDALGNFLMLKVRTISALLSAG